MLKPTLKKISSLANLKQNRGKSRKQLESIAAVSQARKNDGRLRRLLLLAGLDPWLRSFESHQLPRSFFVQLLEDGPDKLAKESLRFLNSLSALQRDKFLTELVDNENERITADDERREVWEATHKRQKVS